MKYWRLIGNMTFWSLWPMLFVYLRSTKRTRVLIEAEGKVLVVKGWLSGGKWSLPGGGLHKHENALNGLVRETKEEVGIELSPEQVVRVGRKKITVNGIPFVCEQFKAHLPHVTQPHIDGIEIIKARWIEPHKLTRKNAYPDVLDLIEV